MSNIFWDELHKNLLPYLRKTRSKRIRENMRLSLHGHSEDIKPSRATITPRETFLMDVLYNYGELTDSLRRFKIISTLIKQYPKQRSWGKVGLNKTVYLRYHYESFLEETYIYRERMRLLLGDLKNKARKKSLKDGVILIEQTTSFFMDTLETATKVRGHHVHMRRYKNAKIEQLADLELFVDDSSYYKDLRDKEYKELRKKLSQEIETFSIQLEKLQNEILNRVTKFAFTELGKTFDDR
jgi:hypothetical protein